MKTALGLALFVLFAGTAAWAQPADLWYPFGCSNTSRMWDAYHDELGGTLGVERRSVLGGGAIDRWATGIQEWQADIQSEDSQRVRGFMLRVEEYGPPTDVLVQLCIRQTPLAPQLTAEQLDWTLQIANFLHGQFPGVRLWATPTARTLTDCRGGPSAWGIPAHQVGKQLIQELVARGLAQPAFLLPDLHPEDSTDGCHQNQDRALVEGQILFDFIEPP